MGKIFQQALQRRCSCSKYTHDKIYNISIQLENAHYNHNETTLRTMN